MMLTLDKEFTDLLLSLEPDERIVWITPMAESVDVLPTKPADALPKNRYRASWGPSAEVYVNRCRVEVKQRKKFFFVAPPIVKTKLDSLSITVEMVAPGRGPGWEKT